MRVSWKEFWRKELRLWFGVATRWCAVWFLGRILDTESKWSRVKSPSGTEAVCRLFWEMERFRAVRTARSTLRLVSSTFTKIVISNQSISQYIMVKTWISPMACQDKLLTTGRIIVLHFLSFRFHEGHESIESGFYY